MIPGTILLSAAKWWKLAAGAALGAFLCFPLATCHGEHIGAQRAALALAQANAKALQQQQRADALAANQRITDTLTVNHQEQELRNVIVSTPDSLPDATRIALGCERLRRAYSSHPTSIPAQCRSGGGVQAGAAR